MKNIDAKMTHVRRCHLCGVVNENEAALVSKCSDCGKHFVPFLFFNERAALGLEVDQPEQPELHMDAGSWPEIMKAKYPPLWGISVYW